MVLAAPAGVAFFYMEALFVSTIVVAVGELGDKTQLLALVLAARFQRPLPIITGIACATIANHAIAGLPLETLDAADGRPVSYTDHLLWPSTSFSYEVRGFDSSGGEVR